MARRCCKRVLRVNAGRIGLNKKCSYNSIGETNDEFAHRCQFTQTATLRLIAHSERCRVPKVVSQSTGQVRQAARGTQGDSRRERGRERFGRRNLTILVGPTLTSNERSVNPECRTATRHRHREARIRSTQRCRSRGPVAGQDPVDAHPGETLH
jgi:hypothetical protein